MNLSNADRCILIAAMRGHVGDLIATMRDQEGERAADLLDRLQDGWDEASPRERLMDGLGVALLGLGAAFQRGDFAAQPVVEPEDIDPMSAADGWTDADTLDLRADYNRLATLVGEAYQVLGALSRELPDDPRFGHLLDVLSDPLGEDRASLLPFPDRTEG